MNPRLIGGYVKQGNEKHLMWKVKGNFFWYYNIKWAYKASKIEYTTIQLLRSNGVNHV